MKLSPVFKWLDISELKMPKIIDLCAKNKTIARKSLVATQPIKIGERFSADNITAKRPGAGISPMRLDEVLGQLSQKDYEKDALIWATS
jgi:sialic acid synthase SpsE